MEEGKTTKRILFGVMLALLLIGMLTSLKISLGDAPTLNTPIFDLLDKQNIQAEEGVNMGFAIYSPWNDWKHYHNYTEIVDTLLYLNSTNSSIVDVFSIGKSWQNRDIYCIKLTNESITHPKPKVFFVGYHHAREPISAELPYYFAVDAATNFGTNTTLTYLLNCSEIYIVPALNVDCFDVVEQNDWQRKNARPCNEDGDGLLDEDPPDDEDGDGCVEYLYFYDGAYYEFIRWEGADDDGDGSLNEDWIGGVDLNRNYGYQWNATCDSGSPNPEEEDYRGPAPFSEPETQAIRDLALQHDFTYAVSFHSGAEIILYPWGYTNTPTPHHSLFKEIGGNLSSLVGAPNTQSGVGLYTTSGVWDDWMYANRSVFALTCEIYTNNSAWQYEPGPDPHTWWRKGIFQSFNPDPANIETVIQRWLPVFTYITNRTIMETRHDVATTSATPLKTIVGQVYSMRINVTVENQGDFTETFNVSVHVNTTVIQTRTITLTRRSSTTMTFTWNTTGFARGNYTLKAVADTLQDEVEILDNSITDGQVRVGVPGNVNGDDIVNMVDIYTELVLRFMAEPGDSRYSANSDINDDGIINYVDIYAAILHFMQTEP